MPERVEAAVDAPKVTPLVEPKIDDEDVPEPVQSKAPSAAEKPLTSPAPRPVKSGLKPRSSIQTPLETPTKYQKNSDFGIVLFAVGSLLLIFIISLYFINPAAFVNKVQKAKSWIQQTLSSQVEPADWQLAQTQVLRPEAKTGHARMDDQV